MFVCCVPKDLVTNVSGAVSREGSSLPEPQPFLRRQKAVRSFLVCSLNRFYVGLSEIQFLRHLFGLEPVSGGKVSPAVPCFSL